MQTSDLDIGGVVGQEQNGPVVVVIGIENLVAREAVPPCLTVTIDDAGAVYLDVPGKCVRGRLTVEVIHKLEEEG